MPKHERSGIRSARERERAMQWRSRYGNQGGYGASSSYGAYTGSYGMGGWGGHGGSGGYGGESGTAGYGGRGTGSYGGTADRLGDMGAPDRRPGQPGWFQARGPHYGKGPKGYRRSDARIYEDVCERIWREGDVDASEVEVQVDDGVVTLSGIVETRGDKRVLEMIAEAVDGVWDVENLLRIRRDPRRTHLDGRGPNAPVQHGAFDADFDAKEPERR